MDSSSLKCFEIGKLVLSSGLLQTSWIKISELHKSTPNQDSALEFEIYREEKYTFVVFVAPPISRNEAASTLLPGSQNPNPFQFLCSENISSFSVHTLAFQLFISAYNETLSDIKSELLKSTKPVIITGAGLGGSVASLFTLWLLETIDPKLKRPLCITFGSTFIGDTSLQQILENSVRNSCFLHVVDATQTPITADFFKPFGMFLICFDSECICLEDPKAIMELLPGVNTDPQDWIDYGEILQRLDQNILAMDSRPMLDDIFSRMDEREADKKIRFDQLKKLNNMKITMAYIEWYKKKSKNKNIGYYDRFRTKLASPDSAVDINVEEWKKELNNYWKSMVEEVEKKPQSEKSILKTRCLFSGNNYRRMLEPLDIAEYYNNGGREYQTSGRSRHYVMLEKWFKAESIEPFRCKNRDLSELLTFDSCFWAEVEDSLIVINSLKAPLSDGQREVLIGKLVRFEEYVWELIGKREVSPEIFLEKSSFMRWWKEYKVVKGSNFPPSNFTRFMDTQMFNNYGKKIP